MRADGTVDISKALEVNVEFDMSRQFWPYLIRKGAIDADFIHPVPHMSFVIGADRCAVFLKTRHATMSAHHCYRGMEYSGGSRQDRRMGAARHGRARSPAGRRGDPHGHGRRRQLRALSRLMSYLKKQDGFTVRFNQMVTNLYRHPHGGW